QQVAIRTFAAICRTQADHSCDAAHAGFLLAAQNAHGLRCSERLKQGRRGSQRRDPSPKTAGQAASPTASASTRLFLAVFSEGGTTMALTSVGLTDIGAGPGLTFNFKVVYEDSLPNQAAVIANANALLAVLESEFNVTTSWFSTPAGKFDPAIARPSI